MNLSFNRLRLPAVLLVVSLGLMAWGTTGCTDHGPVGVFSPELFNRSIGLPHLDIASASSVSFTAGATFNNSPTTWTAGVNQAIIFLLNNGGSSTYGPIQVDFTCSDPNVMFVQTNGQIQAFADNGPGMEVPSSLTSFLTLLRGYSQSGHDYVIDSNDSFQFWYNNPCAQAPGGVCSANYVIPGVTIYMAIRDAIGDIWNTQFAIYITV